MAAIATADISCDTQTLLVFRVGTMLCCAPMAPVVSIIDAAPSYHLPSRNGHKAKVIKHDREIAGLVELHGKFGLARPGTNAGSCLLIVRLQQELIAFHVDEAIDVLQGPHDKRWAKGDPSSWIPHSPFDRVLEYENRMVLHTDFEKLLAMPEVPVHHRPVPQTETDDTDKAGDTAPSAMPQVNSKTPTAAPQQRDQNEQQRSNTPHTTDAVTSNQSGFRQQCKPAQKPAAPERETLQPKKNDGDDARHYRPIPQPAAQSLPDPQRGSRHVSATRMHSAADDHNAAVWVSALFALILLLAGGVYTLWSHQERQRYTVATTTSVETPPAFAEATPNAVAEHGMRLELEDVTIIIEREQNLDADETAPQSADSPPGTTIMVHTVVKGDTLWAIAERYLGNPYRYPALAKISHIRDPHWIYPGDRVRIIRKH